jgi:hypothetical protein
VIKKDQSKETKNEQTQQECVAPVESKSPSSQATMTAFYRLPQAFRDNWCFPPRRPRASRPKRKKGRVIKKDQSKETKNEQTQQECVAPVESKSPSSQAAMTASAVPFLILVIAVVTDSFSSVGSMSSSKAVFSEPTPSVPIYCTSTYPPWSSSCKKKRSSLR